MTVQRERAITEAEKDAYLHSLGLKRIVRDSKSVWVRDESQTGPKFQVGVSTSIRRSVTTPIGSKGS